MTRVCFATALALVLVSGCMEPNRRLNAPPHGLPYKTADMQGTVVYMADNAMLEMMTVSDMHFLPERSILTGLGQQRLSRLASLMQAYGGMIRFNTDLQDKDLIAARMDTIVDFLAEAGIDTTTEVVVQDIPGGRGMPASEAILIRAKEGTYQPDQQEEGASSAR
jgi:hypothetical protein